MVRRVKIYLIKPLAKSVMRGKPGLVAIRSNGISHHGLDRELSVLVQCTVAPAATKLCYRRLQRVVGIVQVIGKLRRLVQHLMSFVSRHSAYLLFVCHSTATILPRQALLVKNPVRKVRERRTVAQLTTAGNPDDRHLPDTARRRVRDVESMD